MSLKSHTCLIADRSGSEPTYKISTQAVKFKTICISETVFTNNLMVKGLCMIIAV